MRRLVFVLLLPIFGFSQAQVKPDAAEILLRLKKLNFLGSVMYVAAHPDDENTRIITLMANERLAATAYLSMTRGDGGQNLIGPEIRDQLGLIRTQELLAARRIDARAEKSERRSARKAGDRSRRPALRSLLRRQIATTRSFPRAD